MVYSYSTNTNDSIIENNSELEQPILLESIDDLKISIGETDEEHSLDDNVFGKNINDVENQQYYGSLFDIPEVTSGNTENNTSGDCKNPTLDDNCFDQNINNLVKPQFYGSHFEIPGLPTENIKKNSSDDSRNLKLNDNFFDNRIKNVEKREFFGSHFSIPGIPTENIQNSTSGDCRYYSEDEQWCPIGTKEGHCSQNIYSSAKVPIEKYLHGGENSLEVACSSGNNNLSSSQYSKSSEPYQKITNEIGNCYHVQKGSFLSQFKVEDSSTTALLTEMTDTEDHDYIQSFSDI